MAKIQLQFHADRSEILAMASDWVRDHGLHTVAERFFPEYRAARVSADELVEIAGATELPDRICLALAAPDLRARTDLEFLDRSPDCLALTLGKEAAEGLRESALASMARDPASLDVWRSLIREASSQMHVGATALNPHTGATVAAPKHLHTAGAHDKAARGIKMLAAAGWNEYRFDDLE